MRLSWREFSNSGMTLTEALCVAIGFVLSSVHCKVVGALVPPIHASRACKQRSRTSLYALNVSTFCPNRSLPPHRSVRGPRPQQWVSAPLLRPERRRIRTSVPRILRPVSSGPRLRLPSDNSSPGLQRDAGKTSDRGGCSRSPQGKAPGAVYSSRMHRV